jgi:hypothetical protein
LEHINALSDNVTYFSKEINIQGEVWHLTQKFQINRKEKHVMLLNCSVNLTTDTKQSDNAHFHNIDRTIRIDDFFIELYNPL